MGRKKSERTEAAKALDAAVLRVAQGINFDGKAFATLAEALNAAGLTTITEQAWTKDNVAMLWKRHNLSVLHIPTTQDTTPQEPQAPSLTTTHTVTPPEPQEAGQALQGDTKQDLFPEITSLEGLTPTHEVIHGVDNGDGSVPQEGLAVDDIEGQDKEGEEVTQGKPVVLQHSDMDDLMDMLTWWQGGGAKGMQAGTQQQGPEIMVKPEFARDTTVTKTIRLSEKMVTDAERKARQQDKAVTHGSFSGLVEWLLWRYLDSSEDYLRREDA